MVLSASKGKLKISAIPTKKAASACVLISFSASGEQSSIGAMKHDGELKTTKDLHESACFAAIMCCVKSRLAIGPVDSLKSSVVYVIGHVRDGSGIISISTYPNRSAVRKALNGFVAALAVPKLYSAYARLIKRVNETPNREYFNHAMSAMLSSIEKADVLVTGKLSVDNDTLKELVDAVSAKWGKIPSISDKKSAPKVTHAVASEGTDKAVKVDLPKGIGAYILSSLIMKRLPGTRVCFCGKSLHVYATESQLDAAANSDRAGEYAKKLHAIVKKVGIEPVIHLAASKACCEVGELITDSNKNWSESALKFSV